MRPAVSSSARCSTTPVSKARAAQGRVNSDGSVAGSIQVQGSGSGALRASASQHAPGEGRVRLRLVRGLPIQPCFNLERTSDDSFRGSISGLGFAYCEFTRNGGRTIVAHSLHRSNSAHPLGLRPSLTADNK